MTGYSRLSADTAKEMIASKTVTIVDIRDQKSYAAGHISNAAHLDNASLQHFIDEADLTAPLIVCCYHGNMSQSAGAFLAERGFDEVYSLDGGFTQWAMRFPESCQSGTTH